jgi:excisionase family DNA binding protein
MALITTNEAAVKLNVSRRRVLALITDERLPAQKMGRDYFIEEADLKLVAERKPGRPKTKETVVEPPVAPAITASELKVGDVVKTKPAKKRAASQKASRK